MAQLGGHSSPITDFSGQYIEETPPPSWECDVALRHRSQDHPRNRWMSVGKLDCFSSGMKWHVVPSGHLLRHSPLLHENRQNSLPNASIRVEPAENNSSG